jgi:predicted transcriptional regulator
MVKTTVYLEPDLATRIKQLAMTEGRPQAQLIRDALADYAGKRKRPAIPGVGEFDSGRPDTSEQAEEILKRASRRGKWR